MRIKHSVSISLKLLALPAATAAVMAYFGLYAIWGERGVLQLETTQAELGVTREQLAQLQEQGSALQHRIALMEQPGADTDLVEELARGWLMSGAPHQVAMARDDSFNGRAAARRR